MRRKVTLLWVWSIIILSFLIMGGCGGGGVQPVQVPDLHNAQVLDDLVTLLGQQTTPSQHTNQNSPLNLEGETAFSFEIQKRPNVAFTVSFMNQVIIPVDTGEHLRYTLDLFGIPIGNYPISITAANAAPQRQTTRSPITIQIWISIPVEIPVVQMRDPNPDRGFHFPYFTFHNRKADKNAPVYIMVFPNGSMPSNDLEDHIGPAVNHLNHRSRTFDALNIMSLIPVFPRLGDPHLYTHALDHHTLKTEIPELLRVDLQLIAMIEDFRKILEDRGYTVAPKILMEGYSASGMYANRFAMIHPEIIEAFSAGHCGGWPTLPISQHEGEAVPYPLGIADLEELTGAPFDMEAFRQVPGFLYAGSVDDNFHRDPDYLDLAIHILGEHASEIWPNARIFYEDAGLPLIEVRMYEGEDMDHSRTFGAATPDVIEFFRSIIE